MPLSPRLMFAMMLFLTLLVLTYGMTLFMENQSREEKLKEACGKLKKEHDRYNYCLLYTSPSPRD